MDFSKMSAYLDTFYKEKNIPGVGCAVYYQGKPVYEHYTGFSDVEGGVPFGPDTMFNLYSATKLITCTAALQLMEQGKIALSDRLCQYIPGYDERITIEQLFSMTAGISGDREAPAVQRVIEQTEGRAPTVDVIRAMAEAPLMFTPGSHFKYGVCHDVLAAVVEIVSGQRFGTYIKEHILDPIGMPDTTFYPTAEQQARRAKHYVNFDGRTGKAESTVQTMKINFGSEYEAGGGGLYSTVPDYILFAQTLANGGVAPKGARILRSETIDDMRKNRLTGEALDDFDEFGGWSKAGYGYGLGVRTLMNRERNNSLSLNGEFGWDGACGCYVVVDPDSGLALFYAQQEAGSPWWTWHGMVRNYAYASCWG